MTLIEETSIGPGVFLAFDKERGPEEKSEVGCNEETDVPGVNTELCDCTCDIVLIVVTVEDSVIVAADSLRPTTGDCGAEYANVCSSSSRRLGGGSLG